MFSPRLTLAVTLVAAMVANGVAGEYLYPQPYFSSGNEVGGVIAVDLDGDGVLDVVSASRDTDRVTVLMGRGDGRFDVRNYWVSGGPVWPAAGDFDENGTIDLAVACYFTSRVSILLGDGDGGFGPSADYGPLDPNGAMFSVRTGDFNNDDHLDLITNTYQGGWVKIFLGSGDGTFGPILEIDWGGDYHVSVGDFNADGNDDFVRPGGVYLGNGNGTFAPPIPFPGSGYHVLAVDLDGDDILDLVAAESPDRVLVLLGNGDGTFDPGQAYPTNYSYPVLFLAADFNGDQLPDLAALSHYQFAESAVSLLYGTGGGQFAPAVGFEPAGESAWSIAAGDFDRDGAMDIVRPGFVCGYLGLLFGDGFGGLLTSSREFVDRSPSGVAVTDLDGDSRPDIAVSNENANTVSVLLAEAAGTFEAEVRYPTGQNPSAVVTGEFSGDTLPDLMTSNRGGDNCTLLVGTGGGDFAHSGVFAVGSAPSDLAVGDFDGDGLDDLAVTNEGSDDVSILLRPGTGPFIAQPTVKVGHAPVSMGVADFDGDEHDDLVVANSTSHDVSVLLGTGDGAFAPAVNVPVGSNPTALAIGDLDDDGNQDLAVVHDRSQGTDDLRIYSGNGAGGFSESQVVPIYNPSAVVVTDMNDDGCLDVGVGTAFQMHALLNTCSGVLEYHAGFAIRRVASGIVGADFNGDALQDLVVSNRNNNDLGILLNLSGPDHLGFTVDGSTLVWPPVTGALSYNVYRGNLEGLVDLDGDGLPDGGHGVCMTSLDNDPTDTFFDDPGIPLADAGFFYLRSVVDAGGETDLGTTSAGLARVPTMPCP